ncbi:Uncharacterized protein dnm_098860 [Desulfonema magnum]|uniref:Uncharacterized protein n=1 Tax=Desulfonema magnum TaxID=45655 RepID=A0A975GW72_9BACT|nr:Uncharacterized protein dnm_098860 [Desulfonema magnum]
MWEPWIEDFNAGFEQRHKSLLARPWIESVNWRTSPDGVTPDEKF